MNKYTSFRDRLPQSLKDIPSTPVAMSSDKIAKAYQEVLSEKEFSNLVGLARSNNSVRNALVELGYGKYGMTHGKAGSFNIVPRENFTKQSMESLRNDYFRCGKQSDTASGGTLQTQRIAERRTQRIRAETHCFYLIGCRNRSDDASSTDYRRLHCDCVYVDAAQRCA